MFENTLGIIPCSKAKIWDAFPDIGGVLAENAYTNPFHQLARSYVNLFAKDWVIFSAKYGFLSPQEIIPEFYDVTFDRPEDPYISIDELKQQIKAKGLHKYRHMIAVCNNRYIAKLEKAFSNEIGAGKIKLEVPFENIEDDAAGSSVLNAAIRRTMKTKG